MPGLTRRGSSFGALEEESSLFTLPVTSPPLLAAAAPMLPPPTWLPWDNKDNARKMLEVIASALCSSSSEETNGAVDCARFLASLSRTSKTLQKLAGASYLWAPVVAAAFGPDCGCSAVFHLPRRSEAMDRKIFASMVHELHPSTPRRSPITSPSFFFRSLIVDCHGKAQVAVVSPPSSPSGFSETKRSLHAEELSRVAFWGSRFTLIDSFTFAPPVLTPRTANALEHGTDSEQRKGLADAMVHLSTVRLLGEDVGEARVRKFEAPRMRDGQLQPFVTVGQLLNSIRTIMLDAPCDLGSGPAESPIYLEELVDMVRSHAYYPNLHRLPDDSTTEHTFALKWIEKGFLRTKRAESEVVIQKKVPKQPKAK